MSTDLSLDEDERDCLQELMNISYGSATAAIAEIIDKFATLDIPDIKTATIVEFKKYLHDKLDHTHVHYVTNQLINGTLSGETMFIMKEESTYNLAREFDLDDDEIDDEELKDVILEISNIITSTTLSKLAELVEASITFSPPQINIINTFDEFHDHYTNEYSHIIIIISTDIKFEDQNIKGELLILSKNDAILYLKEALNKLLDEF
jgi:chemotaxis protein CheC